jgi:hypothetical protein
MFWNDKAEINKKLDIIINKLNHIEGNIIKIKFDIYGDYKVLNDTIVHLDQDVKKLFNEKGND